MSVADLAPLTSTLAASSQSINWRLLSFDSKPINKPWFFKLLLCLHFKEQLFIISAAQGSIKCEVLSDFLLGTFLGNLPKNTKFGVFMDLFFFRTHK